MDEEKVKRIIQMMEGIEIKRANYFISKMDSRLSEIEKRLSSLEDFVNLIIGASKDLSE